VRSRLYSAKFRCPLTKKQRTVALGVTDKGVASKKLNDLIISLEREAAGLTPSIRQRQHAQRPVHVYLDQLLADLLARGKDNEYRSHVKQRATKLIAECDWNLPRDITGESFTSWRAKQTLAARTLNHYLDAARLLVGWINRDGIFGHDPLARVQKVETRGRERVNRRALSLEDCRRLVAASGIRAPVYLMAMHTGLRRSEIGELCWGDLMLDGVEPYMLVRASTTKNKRKVRRVLASELAAVLRSIRAETWRDGDYALRRRLPRGRAFRDDLEAAGIEWKDDLGRTVDLHALRKTFITNMVLAGVAPRMAKEAARHSDQRLTDEVYTDVARLPVDDIVTKLPRLVAEVSPIVSPKFGSGVRVASQADASCEQGNECKPLRRNAVRRVVASSDANGLSGKKNGERGIRTPGTVSRTHAFQACSLSHSDISPINWLDKLLDK